MYYLYLFSKITKYIALVSVVITLFSDLYIFKLLCCLVLIDLALNFSALKCSFLQIVGMVQVGRKFKDRFPSVETYQSEVNYILPFQGRWVAVNGCSQKAYSHSWDIPTQRYAYDFIMLDEDGKSYRGEFSRCESYYCYNQEILAPADGVVVEIVNTAKDTLIFPKGRFMSKAKHIAGNYIVIRHTQHEYSTLAHLKKDSITVKVGDAVTKGQAIAKCGNTGNSSEPHLHFQLQTGQNFYSSAGVPIHFKGMSLSQAANYEKYDPRPHMALEQVADGYLTRGFSVENRQ